METPPNCRIELEQVRIGGQARVASLLFVEYALRSHSVNLTSVINRRVTDSCLPGLGLSAYARFPYFKALFSSQGNLTLIRHRAEKRQGDGIDPGQHGVESDLILAATLALFLPRPIWVWMCEILAGDTAACSAPERAGASRASSCKPYLGLKLGAPWPA
jgi:hypothetical protein